MKLIHKNLTHVFLMFSLVLVSCAEEMEKDSFFRSDNVVTFGTYVGNSRASVIDATSLQTSADGFGVMAYHTGEVVYDSATKPNYMNNQQVVYNNGHWTYSPIKYWSSSADEKISFFAYAPYVDAPVALDATESGITALPSSGVVGDPLIRYEFGSDISKHIDLLYASAKDKTNTSGAVNFEFKHALSRIGFKVCGWEDDGSGVDFDNNTIITINAVTLSTTRHGASLNLANGVWSESITGDVQAFTLSDEILQNNVVRPGDPAKRINTDDGYVMIVPDNFITDDASKRYCVLVDYTVETLDPNLAAGKFVTRNKVYRYLSPNFEPGKAYTINIHLCMADNTTADDAIDDGPTPVDPNPDDPTEPSTSGKNSYVHFTATVTDWEQGEDIHTIPPKIAAFNATYDTFNISGDCRYESAEMPILTLKSFVADGSSHNALRSEFVVTGPHYNINAANLNYAYVQPGVIHTIHAKDKYGQEWETTVIPEFGEMGFTLTIPVGNTPYSLPFNPDDDSYSSAVLAVWDEEDQSEILFPMTYENKQHTYETPGIKKVRVLCSSTDTQNPQIGYFDISNYGGSNTRRLYYSFDTPILKTSQTYFNSSFSGCSNLVSICEDLFKNFPSINVFSFTFSGCASLESIPEGLFQYTNDVENFIHTFDGCESLSAIPENLFANTTKVSIFVNTFNNCFGLKSIPAKLFAKNVDCESFVGTFRNCNHLTSIPENLFACNRKATSFATTFFECSNLASIPEKIFNHNIDAQNFSSVFEGCSSITEIPENLFLNNTQAISFNSAFSKTNIGSIPQTLFSTCEKASSFIRTFALCSSLNDVPESLISNCTLATDCSQMFYGCTALTHFPSDFFASNDKVKKVSSLFNGCSSLENIPASIFKTCPEITDFSYCFFNCTSLTSIPEGLFDVCLKASNFKSTFSNCFNLKTVPNSLFDCNFPSSSSTTNSAEGLFWGCYRISSSVPELWKRPEISKYTNAYKSCSSAANYSSIPDSWK